MWFHSNVLQFQKMAQFQTGTEHRSYVQLSERHASLGIEASLKPLGMSQHCRIEDLRGTVNWYPIMPRDTRLSDSQCFSLQSGGSMQFFFAVCSSGTFGSNCHLRCKDNGDPCLGLTFCLRDPQGCHCAPGFVPPDCDDGGCRKQKQVRDFYQIERNMIIVTVFFLIMNQTEFRLVYNIRREIVSTIIFLSI